MIDGKRILAIVTARGGSKGVPGKNIKPLAGKPLIGWTIEAIKRSRSVDRVVVSSDSEAILETARRFGADAPFVRPAELATDTAKQEDAVLHAMRWAEANDSPYRYLMMLTPTCPLRDARLLDKVAEFLVRHPKAKAAVTVVPCEHSPLTANVLPEDRCMAGFIPEEIKLKNRQELPPYYRVSGAVCMIEWEHFKEQGSVMTPLTYAYPVGPEEGLDIDGPLDLILAEALLTRPATPKLV